MAARVAGRIKAELGVEPFILNGWPGEFSVLVAEKKVLRKGWFGLPSEEKVMGAIKTALQDETPSASTPSHPDKPS